VEGRVLVLEKMGISRSAPSYRWCCRITVFGFVDIGRFVTQMLKYGTVTQTARSKNL